MDLEKFRQYANSKINTDKMRKEIKETLDEYKTTQRLGYEAAKTKFKPLLEAQAAQTKAQEAQAEAQTAAMKQIIPFKKPEEFSKTLQEFIKKYNFPLPSLLLSQGIYAYKNEKEDIWKDNLLNLSLEVTKLIEITDDPAIKKAAGEYKKQLKTVVTTVVTPQKQQKQPQGFTTPQEALSPATSTENLIEVDPRQLAAEKVFDYPLEVPTTTYLDEQKLRNPSLLYLDGLNAEAAGEKQYYKWQKDFKKLLSNLNLSKDAAIGNEKYILNNYLTQLQKVKDKLPTVSVGESNLNYDFSDLELERLQLLKLKTPQAVFNLGIKSKMASPEAYINWKLAVNTKINQLKKTNSNSKAEMDKANIPVRKKYYLKLGQIIANAEDTKIVAGKGRNRKKCTMGSGIFMNSQDLFKKLELITGSIIAGNTSNKIRNDAYKILDKLLEIGLITKTIYNKYIKEYLKH